MSRCVIDASVAASWAFRDERTPASQQLLRRTKRGELVAPAIWPFEVLNTLLAAGRRERISHQEITRFLRLLSELSVAIDTESVFTNMDRIRSLAETYALTAYDASYLE